MKRIKKMLWIGSIITLALLIFIGVIGIVYIDAAAKTAIETGGTYALGVSTWLEKARLRPLAGHFGLDGLSIENPEGFDDTHFLVMNRADAELVTGSLLSDTVRLPRLELDGITVNLQKKGKQANYEVILTNLERFESTEEPATPAPQDGKKFVIDEVIIRNVTVQAEFIPLMGKLSQITVRIPEIRLQDVGTESDQGAMMAQVSGTLMEAILLAVVEKGAGLLPEAMLSGLGEGLKSLEGIGKIGMEVVGEVDKAVEKVGQGMGEAGDKVLKETGKVFEGIGGLLKGDDDKAEK